MRLSKHMPSSSLVNLNKNTDTVGYVDTLNVMSSSMVRVIENSSDNCFISFYPKDPCE